ncbi:unnamed protein product [Heterobilharzia americana]|nr:unnamed protein product [Heterobilharzia americana]
MYMNEAVIIHSVEKQLYVFCKRYCLCLFSLTVLWGKSSISKSSLDTWFLFMEFTSRDKVLV